MPTDAWSVVSSLAAAASALFAGVQIRITRRDGKRLAAFSALREVEQRLATLLAVDVRASREEAIAYYRRDTDVLSAEAGAYLNFLNHLEGVAIARLSDVLDPSVTDEYLKTILAPHIVDAETIEALQACCGDEQEVFRSLLRYLLLLRPEQRRSGWSSLEPKDRTMPEHPQANRADPKPTGPQPREPIPTPRTPNPGTPAPGPIGPR